MVTWMEGFRWRSQTFDVALHLGTLVGCLICLWSDVSRYSAVKALTGRSKWTNDAKVSILIIATAVPASLFAVSLESFLLKQGERIGIIAMPIFWRLCVKWWRALQNAL